MGKTTALFAGHFGKYESGNKGKTMFTIEHQSEDTIITTLDASGQSEDVEVMIDDDSVFMRQWHEKRQKYEVLEMSIQQFNDIIAAMNLPEGAYYAK